MKNNSRKIDLSKISAGLDNSKTETYNFNDSFDFVDENGTNYSGAIKSTTTATSYQTSETKIKKGGHLSELIKNMNKG